MTRPVSVTGGGDLVGSSLGNGQADADAHEKDRGRGRAPHVWVGWWAPTSERSTDRGTTT